MAPEANDNAGCISYDGDDGGYPPMRDCHDKFAQIDRCFDRLEADMRGARSEISGLHKWIVGVGISIICVLVAIITFQASWFQHSLEANMVHTRENVERIEKKADQYFQQSQKTLDKIHAIELRMERLNVQPHPILNPHP